ncbi:hypothetical protein OUZ56_022770 [Daphnia magna]|uniref:Uncharacterized protein n=1 Tax=Daphnia magna TaxID=35525 RepID=A0ABR0AXE4_9CRUS|nr:hypothetical protein OUZ56_022770 [Daphnia magna]
MMVGGESRVFGGPSWVAARRDYFGVDSRGAVRPRYRLATAVGPIPPASSPSFAMRAKTAAASVHGIFDGPQESASQIRRGANTRKRIGAGLSYAQTAQQPNAIGLFFRSLVCLLLTALDEKDEQVGDEIP